MTPKICCFGETLWDIFPDKKVIGGAPLNVALRLHSLGANVRMISSIGRDKDGENLIQYLKESNVDTRGIQINDVFPTGNVQVHLDKHNTASYTISEPVAWDNIISSEQYEEIISKADAFIFGSLACRNQRTKNTLLGYLEKASFKVFDANMRAPYYHMNTIMEFMYKADLIKLNEEELDEILSFLEVTIQGMEAQIKYLSEYTNTAHICITLGAKGAVLYTNSDFYQNKGYKVRVQDTVGAGDSFLASLIYKLMTHVDPQTALDDSCAMGSLVASKPGATARVSHDEIKALQEADRS